MNQQMFAQKSGGYLICSIVGIAAAACLTGCFGSSQTKSKATVELSIADFSDGTAVAEAVAPRPEATMNTEPTKVVAVVPSLP